MTVKDKFNKLNKEIQDYQFYPDENLWYFLKLIPNKMMELKSFALSVTEHHEDLNEQIKSNALVFIDQEIDTLKKMGNQSSENPKYTGEQRNRAMEFTQKGVNEFVDVCIYKLSHFDKENILIKEVD